MKKLVRKQGQVESTVYVDGVLEHHRVATASQVRENNTLHVLDDEARVATLRIGQPLPSDATPAVKYHLTDHLGSSNVVADDSGTLVDREEYTPYGDSSFGSFGRKRYRFTSKERDEESGLNYHGVRYYAPWLARWISCDPRGPVDSVNLYRYCRNRPTVLVDPAGTRATDPAKEKREELEKKYRITIKKGDKEWSESDVDELTWAFSRLSKKEASALEGYLFLRWKDPKSRSSVDPTYDPTGKEETGYHEPDFKSGIFKISLYDATFDKDRTFQFTVKGKEVGNPQTIGRKDMLHEIGHAMAVADYRKAWAKYSATSESYNSLVAKHNAASGKEQSVLGKRAERLAKKLTLLENAATAAKGRAEHEFEKLAKGMTPVTEYAGTNAVEGFAESFAMYKLEPRLIRARNPDLAKWFKAQRYLKER